MLIISLRETRTIIIIITIVIIIITVIAFDLMNSTAKFRDSSMISKDNYSVQAEEDSIVLITLRITITATTTTMITNYVTTTITLLNYY